MPALFFAIGGVNRCSVINAWLSESVSDKSQRDVDL